MQILFQTKVKKRKDKMAMAQDLSQERTSMMSVRMVLKEFCVEFLNGAYNPVMKFVRQSMAGGAVVIDTSHYMWSLRFFMEFNRHYKFQVKLVRCRYFLF